MQAKQEKIPATINSIARKPGTNKMDPVFYNPKAPHNQPAPKHVMLKDKG